MYFKCLLRHVVLCVLCFSVCLFLNAPFCHGDLKLDLSLLFARLFVLTPLQFIFKDYIFMYVNDFSQRNYNSDSRDIVLGISLVFYD